MKYSLLCAAAAAALAIGAASAKADLLYSFETGTVTSPDGFGPNGGGFTVAQSLGVGATHPTLGPPSHSLSATMVQGATFAGALTGTVAPVLSSTNASNTQIVFDLTVVTPFTGAFANLGVIMFGATQPGPGQQFGIQAQSNDFEHLDGKAAGTYTVVIDLVGTNPLTFDANQNFFTGATPIFGGGATQLIPTGFEIYLNKSNDAAATFFIDNVRNNVPEPTSLALAAVGGLGLMARRRR